MAETGFSFLNTNSSSSPFGFSNPSSTSSAPSFGFGSSASTSSSLFGNVFGSSSSSNPFGGSSSSSSSTNIFGSSCGAAPTTNLFGSSSSSATGQTTTSLFGSSSSAASAPSSTIFGTSTLFGSPSPSSSGLFGSSSAAASTTTTTTSNLFGSGSVPVASSFGSSTPASVVTSSVTPLFGTGPSPSPGLLGSSAPASGSAPAPATSLLGSPSVTTTSSLFGSSTPGLFGSSSSFGSSSAASSSATGFSFLKASTTSASTAAPGFSFSTASSATSNPAFSLSTAANQTTSSVFSFTKSTTSLTPGTISSSPASSTGFSFGTMGFQSSGASTSSQSKPTAFSTTTSSLFPTSSTTTAATTATVTAASTSDASSGFTGFSVPPSTSKDSAVSTGASGPSSSFTGFSTISSTPASSSSGSTSSFSLSFKSSTTAASSASQSTAALPSIGVTTGASTSSSASSSAQVSSSLVPSSSGTASTALASAPKLPSEITGKTVEEIIKEWNTELQERTGKFRKQAKAIAEWDLRILTNRDSLLRLEVDKALQCMEEQAQRIYREEQGLLLDDEAASTRDAMYAQSEFIERELEQMTEQIKSIINTLNANQMHRGNSSRGGGRGDKGKKKVADELIAGRVRPTGSERQKRADARTGAEDVSPSIVLRIRRSDLDSTFVPPRQTQPEDSGSDESLHVTPSRRDSRFTTGGKGPMMNMGPEDDVRGEEMEDDTEDEEMEEPVRPAKPSRRVARSSSSVGGTSRRRGDEAWRLKTAVEGGPTNPELLTGFLGHVAYQIWAGQERGLLQGEHKYHVLRNWGPNSLREDARDLVYSSGLVSLYESMYMYIDMSLISAFIERWHPETNSFHMPFGEMTITLHDVHYLLRIPIDGAPVVVTSEAVSDIQSTTAGLLGMSLEDLGAEWRSGAGVKFTTIHARMLEPGLEGDRVAAGYLLWLLGVTIFSDKNKNSVTAHYLPLLLNVDDVDRYSWGSATLAYLYRQLGIASRADCRGVSGCLTLLQAWIYAYFPTLEAQRNEAWTANQPYASKWQPEYVSSSHSALIRYRRMLDRCRENEVAWTPFRLTPGSHKPISLFSGIIHCRHITEPYMPERVLRQFGYVQTVPWIPAEPDNVTWSTNPKAYLREHHGHPSAFRRALSSIIQLGMISHRTCARMTMVEEYLPWYLQRTHPRVDKSLEDSAQSSNDNELWDMAYTLLQDVHPLIRRTPSDPNDMENTIDTLCYMFEHKMPEVMRRREERRMG